MKLRNLIFILFMSVLFLFTVIPAQASPIWESDASGELTGSRSNPFSSGVYATEQWNYTDGFVIDWVISQDLTTFDWTYTYNVTADTKGLSHFILEVTDDGEDFNIEGGTSTPYLGPDTWDVNSTGSSNPLMPNPIYGVKFEFGNKVVTYTMITDRSPVYGVFYTKDGKNNQEDVVAWSYALNFNDYKTNEALTITDFIVRPDSGGGGGGGIPEPATILLLGSGLLGLAVSGKKRFKKRNG